MDVHHSLGSDVLGYVAVALPTELSAVRWRAIMLECIWMQMACLGLAIITHWKVPIQGRH